MPITYDTSEGDTFDIVARKVYGDDTQGYLIRHSNPGVAVPLQVGIEIIIPELPDAPQNVDLNSNDSSESKVVVLINGKRFKFWDSAVITRSLDSFDTIELSAPMDASNVEFRKAFRQLSFDRIVVMVDGEPLFTGTVVSITPDITDRLKVVEISGYSLPGVLNDCTPPASVYPAQEFSDQGLTDIAKVVAGWFGLGVSSDVGQGVVFKTVACNADKKVLSFLTGLAQQRNLIISNTSRGRLLITQSTNVGSPVATLKQGEPPLMTATPKFKPQQYFSHVTGIAPESLESDGAQFTLRNNRLSGVIRPLTFIARDADFSNLQAAVKSKAGRMFGNVVSYSIEVSTWYDPGGKLWSPNTTLVLHAPDVMIYKPFEFIIRSVEFEIDSESKTALIILSLPGVFSGELPESLPWDE